MLTVDAWSLGELDDADLVAFVWSLASLPRPSVRLDRVEDALADFTLGRPVVVVDDEDRENEGDLIFAASAATEELVGFMTRWTSGLICVAMTGEELDRLRLPPMASINQDPKGTAYAVSVDSRSVQSTGISALDRACTLKALADSATSHSDLSRPGHVVPLRAACGGVLQRGGHTEAAVDLARLAGLPPAGALAELVNDDGTMMRAHECRDFADQHGLRMISIADLARFRWQTQQILERTAETSLCTEFGDFVAAGYRNPVDGTEHVALIAGEVGDGHDVLVRVHTECTAGDLSQSLGCSCGEDLRAALRTIAGRGRGVLIYVRDPQHQPASLVNQWREHIGRGGFGATSASLEPTNPAGFVRETQIARQMLKDLKVRSARMLTSEQSDQGARGDLGIPVRVEPLVSQDCPARELRLLA